MKLLTFSGSSQNDPRIEEWFADHQGQLGRIAAEWFRSIRIAGDDITELLHDGYPTACIEDYPFAYVGVFKSHVNVGFFYGAQLADPEAMLQGTGKRMRHVKIKPGDGLHTQALAELVTVSYRDIKHRIATQVDQV